MGNTSVRRESDGAGIPESVANQLLENIDSHAVFMLDGDGAITAWPPPAAALYGYDAESILGEDVSVLFTDGDGTSAGEPPDGFLSEADGGTTEVEHWHERADGSVFWGTLTLSSLSGEAGFVAISQNETTTKEYERMLERQNDRLKEFTDILAHDLRNPLSVIDGNLALYEETGDEAHIETIGETTDRMARLVDDLLRVARQGDVVTDPEPTDVGAVVGDATAVVEATGGGTVSYHEVPMVSGDPDRLCELFENLFRNAVEHSSTSPDSHTQQDSEGRSPSGSRTQSDDAVEHSSTSPRSSSTREDAVEHSSTSPASHTQQDAVEHSSTSPRSSSTRDDAVEHSSTSPASHTQQDAVEHDHRNADGDGREWRLADDGTVTITVGPLETGFYVEDDGPGISDDRQDDVFDHGFTTTAGGNGYGLSVVRTIVNAHGWDIRVTDGESGGARFEITGIDFLE